MTPNQSNSVYTHTRTFKFVKDEIKRKAKRTGQRENVIINKALIKGLGLSLKSAKRKTK